MAKARENLVVWLRAAAVLLAIGGLLIVLLGLIGSLLTATEHGQPLWIDRELLRATRTALGPRLEGSMVQITALGSKTVLTLVTVIAAMAAWLGQRRRAALEVALAGAGAGLLTLLLKQWVERPRPDLMPWLDEWVGASYSFPSGHAFSAMAIYGALGVILGRLAPTSAAARFTFGASILIAVLVGVSRVYLGVHYPTDVLAGWLAGGTWAWACSRALPADEPLAR